jgi:hypothetical protein
MTFRDGRSSDLLGPERTTTIVRVPDAAPAPGFGVHLTLDGYGGDQRLLADGEHVLACLSELPERLGMHKLIEPFLVELGHHSAPSLVRKNSTPNNPAPPKALVTFLAIS